MTCAATVVETRTWASLVEAPRCGVATPRSWATSCRSTALSPTGSRLKTSRASSHGAQTQGVCREEAVYAPQFFLPPPWAVRGTQASQQGMRKSTAGVGPTHVPLFLR